MAMLFDAYQTSKDGAELYIPDEDLTDEEAAAKDKDLVQQLDSSVIRWTRQIKKEVYNQDSQQERESSKPSKEIDHWKKRKKKLTRIKEQLDKNQQLQKIKRILRKAESPHLQNFEEEGKRIDERTAEAENNVKYLEILTEPFKKLEAAQPKEISALLPEMLQRIRIIWELSDYYGQQDKMGSLLTKISNEIIQRCKDKISIDDLLDGDVEKCIRDLEESIACGEEWRRQFEKTQKLILASSPKKSFEFGKVGTKNRNDSIFAQVEAFKQRCNDLKEIGQGQLQFALKGKDTILPDFPGSKGKDITYSLEELKKQFNKHLDSKIREVNKAMSVLEPNNPKWHENITTFKNEMKELDTMLLNIVSIASSSICTVVEAAELVENFDYLSKRQSVRDGIYTKIATEHVYQKFIKEATEIDHIFDHWNGGNQQQFEQRFLLAPPHPYCSGLALFVRSLISRLDYAYKGVEMLFFVDNTGGDRERSEKLYKITKKKLENQIKVDLYAEWKKRYMSKLRKDNEEEDLKVKLEKPVIIEQQIQQPAHHDSKRKFAIALECNFDKDLQEIYAEVKYWEKLQYSETSINSKITKFYHDREQMRVLRESVMLAVRDYNLIVQRLEEDEKKLFAQHLMELYGKIMKNMHKYKWSTLQNQKFFQTVRDWRSSCEQVYNLVERYKRNIATIENKLKLIEETVMLEIDKSKAHPFDEFASKQQQVIAKHTTIFNEAAETIRKCVMDIYDPEFVDAAEEIQYQFVHVVLNKYDNQLLEKLKRSVSRSLQEFLTALGTDEKEDTCQQFIKIDRDLLLEKQGITIAFSPKIEELAEEFDKIFKNIKSAGAAIPRLARRFREEREELIAQYEKNKKIDEEKKKNNQKVPERTKTVLENVNRYEGKVRRFPSLDSKLPATYDEILSQENEIIPKIRKAEDIIKKEMDELTKGFKTHSSKCEQPLVDEQKVRAYHTKPKKGGDITGEFWERVQSDLEDKGITRAIETLRDLTTTNIKKKFVEFDAGKLKEKLNQLERTVKEVRLKIIYDTAKKEMLDLKSSFTKTIETLRVNPQSAEELKVILAVKDKIKVEEIKKQITSIQGAFDALKRKDFTIQIGDINDKNSLPTDYDNFISSLAEAEGGIEKSKKALKETMQRDLDTFAAELDLLAGDYDKQAPKSIEKNDVAGAKRIINDFKEKLAEKEKAKEDFKSGIELFKIEEMTYPKITYLKKELALQTQFWNLKEKWDEESLGMEGIQFRRLDIDEMGRKVTVFIEELEKLPNEIKEWPVFTSLNKDIILVKDILPLVQEISTNAMKTGHWQKLYSELKCEEFNPDGDFTFAKIKQLHLEKHEPFIRGLSEEARRDLELEMSLKNIEERWGKLKLVINHDKDTGYYKMQTYKEVLEALEKDLSILSEMKSSESFPAFQAQIDNWEIELRKVSEVLELLWQVQNQWKKQEAIFNGQGSLSKQLTEKGDFDIVHKKFMAQMGRIFREPNVKRACLEKGFDKELKVLNEKLESIDRILTNFLESKRGVFPRFYFLSNDELLEIVGCAHNIDPVQKHLKKMFEGIASIKKSPTKSGTIEIIGVGSIEEEELKLDNRFEVNKNDGVEDWLNNLKVRVSEKLKNELPKCSTMTKENNKDAPKRLQAFLERNTGQIILAATQAEWTEMTENNLKTAATEKDPLGKDYETYNSLIQLYGDQLRSSKFRVDLRLKLQLLLTVTLHLRDVIADLRVKGVSSTTSFEWVKRLRMYVKNQTKDIAMIKQGYAEIQYDYEYQGNNGRLVVTPLTERCYLVLTTAIFLRRGGAPHGPAGTGKTETVKDLAKVCGKYVVVFNCSEGLTIDSLDRMFSGLVVGGAWGCFDEFNRIEVEVLSVAAHKISAILDAIRIGQNSVELKGSIGLNPGCALFITYNPGYSTRSELPDNLKTLFRPIAMVAPDSEAIAENLFFSEGFGYSKGKEKGEKVHKELSKKVISIYNALQKLLSKQPHYDFGLRAIISSIKYAGNLRQQCNEKEIDQEKLRDIVYKALDDLISPVLVAEDTEIFETILSDMFPQKSPVEDNEDLIVEIENIIDQDKLTHNNMLKFKMIQIFNSMRVRHGNMIVGPALSGKTTCWKILARALTSLKEKKEAKDYTQVKWSAINPKAVTVDELFGYTKEKDKEKDWHSGVMASILKQACEESLSENKQRWIVLDGPVDPKWIESLNSLLDDNKCLTLGNGERISLNPLVKILFEVDSLTNASPATVSRCGMTYCEIHSLGYIESWIEMKNEQDKQLVKYLVDKYLNKVLDVKRRACFEPVKTSEEASVINLCRLFDAVIPKKRAKEEMLDDYARIIERNFIYSLAWSIGGTVDEGSRKEIDQVLRDIDATHCPNLSLSGTIYDFFVSVEKGGEWTQWEEKVQQNVKFDLDTPYHELIINTVDSVRNMELVKTLVEAKNNVLILGNIGVGKTALVNSLIKILGTEAYHSFSMLLSGNTSAAKIQEIIESKFESHSRGRLFQPKNRLAICFVDDINMPKQDEFGSQPPLELLRQWMDYGGWYDREKIIFKEIVGLLLIAAMAPRRGGREEISFRTMTKFQILNFIPPSEKQICRIFSKIAEHKLQTFEDEEIKKMPEDLAASTFNMYKSIIQQFLPTPKQCHYLFNMRDMSKIFQGLQRANKTYYETKETVVCLWVHECICMFNDRLISQEDRNQFRNILNNELNKYNMTYEDIQAKYKGDLLFFDYKQEEERVYRDVKNFEELRKFLETKLTVYNSKLNLNIVLFKDAVYNLCKIYRVLRMSHCHCLLLGVGGSGRHSLARLAGAVAEMELEAPETTKKFDYQTFRAVTKLVFRKSGIDAKQTIFLLSDNELMSDPFFEDLSNILTSGDVPGLYNSDELRKIRDDVAEKMKKDMQGNAGVMIGQQQQTELEELHYGQFTDRVANNLHVILCFSPLGSKFRNSCRDYPAILNTTSIIWFLGWPEYALTEVAKKFVIDTEVPVKLQDGLAKVISFMHSSATTMALKMRDERRRMFYLTPTHYMDLMKEYLRIKNEKTKELELIKNKLSTGLLKFKETEKKAEVMTADSTIKKQKNSEKMRNSSEMAAKLQIQFAENEAQEAIIKQKAAIRDKQKEEAEALFHLAEEEIARAEPKLQEAQAALKELSAQQIAEVKNYTTPPPEVQTVLQAVMIIIGKPPTWSAAKKAMADAHFKETIVTYEVSNLTDSQLKELETYTKKSEFKSSKISSVSAAGYNFSKWVLATEDVAKALRSIEPKKRKRDQALEIISKLNEEMDKLREKKQKLADTINELSMQRKKVEDEKEELKKDIDILDIKIERAEQLTKNLADFNSRWEKELVNLKDKEAKMPGDALLSAGFLCYCGPLNREYRMELNTMWVDKIKEQGITMSPTYDFCVFMVGEPTIREWRMNSLPTDKFSEQNAVIIMKTDRWPLVIDPQDQISHWLKATENKPEGRFKQIGKRANRYLTILEASVAEGKAVQVHDIGEELDFELDNLLRKSFSKVGDVRRVKIVKDVKYNPNFKLYLTTKLSNPHFSPEIYTKVTIVNFALTEQALEDQLLDILFETEEKELSKKKENNAKNIDSNKRLVVQNEQEILQLLSESTSSLVEDDTLVHKMRDTKELYENNSAQIISLEQNMKKIEDNRGKYRACAKEAAILFFVLDDLAHLDPMYQFSLKNYRVLFKKSIESSSNNLGMVPFEQKMEKMKDTLKSNVFKMACITLFEKHKLLLAFQICYRLKMSDWDQELWQFFLKGGIVLNRKDQPHNINSEWLPSSSWDNVTELDKMPVFAGIVSSMQLSTREWGNWYMHPQPELQNLPSEWDSKCDDPLKKLVIIRSLRPDRVTFVVRDLIKKYWPGYKDANTKPVSIREVMENTKTSRPLLCILGPGVDPAENLSTLAAEMLEKGKRMLKVSLGQEEGGIVAKALEEGITKDTWVYFANCHYAINSILDLGDQLVSKLNLREKNKEKKDEHKSFRVILSSTSHPKFPVALLKNCEKLTIEPLTGIKANMCRIYQSLPEATFKSAAVRDAFAKSIFSLAFYHCVLIERRRFRNLGWNIVYNFNEADILACQTLLQETLQQNLQDMNTIQELVTEALYGGRVTDDNDRDLLRVYTKEFFSDSIFAKDWRPVKLKDDIIKYEYPQEQQALKSEEEKKKFIASEFLEHIGNNFPSEDVPEVFGQHLNAEISTQIEDTNLLLSSILAMQPKADEIARKSEEEEILKKVETTLGKDVLPERIDIEGIRFKMRTDPNPMNYVLNQEAQRYNNLIDIVKISLEDLKKSLKGEIVMTTQMDEIYNRLHENRVPLSWRQAYPSVKPFGVWLRDLKDRVSFFSLWVKQGQPSPFLLPAFTSPLSFTTALLQKYARKKKIANIMDVEMQHEFLSERIAVGHPEEGAYVKGLKTRS